MLSFDFLGNSLFSIDISIWNRVMLVKLLQNLTNDFGLKFLNNSGLKCRIFKLYFNVLSHIHVVTNYFLISGILICKIFN
jgi:hypothetical protein